MSLQLLAGRIRKDPALYRREFEQKWEAFQAAFATLDTNPKQNSKELQELCQFVSEVSPHYPNVCSGLPDQMMKVMENHAAVLHPMMRSAMIKSLITLRRKRQLSPLVFLPLCFRLFRIPDQKMRAALTEFIVRDIRTANSRKRSNELNAKMQNFMYTMLDGDAVSSKCSLDIMIELAHRGVWSGASTVNVVAKACLSKHTKNVVAACKFFLEREDPVEEEDLYELHEAKQEADKKLKFKRKTKKRVRNLTKIMNRTKNIRERANREPTFPSIQLLNDPTGFSEKLFRAARTSKDRFEVRVLMLDLLSRVLTVHSTLVPSLFPFLQKYIFPRQRHVTKFMAILVQSCHPLVAPELLEPTVMHIANHFVTDRSGPEAIGVGINTIREMCVRCPLVMSEALLRDLIDYRQYKEKGVQMAAKSLLHLFRELNPMLLKSKDRGRMNAAQRARRPGYMQSIAQQDGIDADLLFAEAARPKGEDNSGIAEYDDSDDDFSAVAPTAIPIEIETKAVPQEEEIVDSASEVSDFEDCIPEDYNVKPVDGRMFLAAAESTPDGAEPGAKRTPALRILDEADFELLHRRQKKRNLAAMGIYASTGDTDDEAEEEPDTDDMSSNDEGMDEHDNNTGFVDPTALAWEGNRKTTYEEKVAAGREGKDNRQSFGRNRWVSKGQGRDNESKKRNQPFMLQKRKVAEATRMKSLAQKMRRKVKGGTKHSRSGGTGGNSRSKKR